MAWDYGSELTQWLYVHSGAAIGFARRVGLGKIRHLETQSVCLQEAVGQKRLGLAKVPGTVNPTLLMTKFNDSKTMERLMAIINLERRPG